jgi:hypothetical protein
MTTSEVSEPQAAPKPKNVFARIAGVLFAPADAFEEIVRRPAIVWPLVLIVAISFVSSALMVPRIDFESVKAMQAEQLRKQNPKMSDADLERFGRVAVASSKVIMWIAPLLTVVMFAAIAGVLLLAFRMMAGEGNFAQAMSVTLYAWMPLLLFSIIMLIVVVARWTFDPTMAATVVKSNPAFLVDMKEQPVLFALLSSLDVFTIWSVVLFILGFSAMSRLSKGTSAGIVLVLWGVMIVLKLGMAALRG